MSAEIKTYHPIQVKKAMSQFRLAGYKIRQICLEMTDKLYYDRLHSRLKNSIPIPISFLQPIIDKAPEFRDFLDAEPEMNGRAERAASPRIDYKAESEKLEALLDERLGEMKKEMARLAEKIGDSEKWKDEYIALLKKVAGVDDLGKTD